MLSKFALVNARGSCLTGTLQWLRGGAARRQPDPLKVQVRRSTGDIFPPSQYDSTFPEKMKFGTVIINNYEIIPLFAITAFAITMMFFHIIWASKNKVDVVFSSRSANNISRTMNLRHPTIHKLVIIAQRYDPWPEMQDVLDKMMVDVVWEANSRDNISRTMDMEYPTVHKMFIINQRYEPWPEMKIVLKKIKDAMHRELSRQEFCNYK